VPTRTKGARETSLSPYEPAGEARESTEEGESVASAEEEEEWASAEVVESRRDEAEAKVAAKVRVKRCNRRPSCMGWS
jgi:hypothetical protein